MKVVVHVDGGSRGNPGPAAAAAVVSDPQGAVLIEAAERLGSTTSNVAEYHAVLLGLSRASELGATEVELINDSELVARQLTGAYRVKHEGLRPLHAQAIAALAQFEGWRVRTVRREHNDRADALVNAALDGRELGTTAARPDADAGVGATGEVVVVALARARPGAEQRIHGVLVEAVEVSRREPGCLLYALHRSPDDPGLLVVIERWRSQADLDAHLAQPHARALSEAADLLVEDPRVSILQPVVVGEDPETGAL